MAVLNPLEGVSLGFVFVVITLFCLIVYSQYSKIEPETYRLQVISTRCVMCLPLYALFIWISMMDPHAFEAMMVLITLVEGVTFYNFAALLVVNIGGPTECVRAMKMNKEKLCCTTMCCAPFSGCVSEDKSKHYVTTSWAVFYFWWVRLVLVTVGTIAFYGSHGGGAGKALLMILNLVAAAFLVYMLVNLVNMYENIYEHCKNINGVGKVFLMKVSVGLITILSNIENAIVTFGGKIEVRGNTDDDAHDMTQRATAAFLLIIFCFFSLLALPIFGKKIAAPKVVYNEKTVVNAAHMPTLGRFLCDMCQVWDTLGVLSLKENPLIDDSSTTGRSGNFI